MSVCAHVAIHRPLGALSATGASALADGCAPLPPPQALADDAKKDLDEALPALDSAVAALNALNRKDIVEIKSFTTPPELVRTTMEAVCILLGTKPDWDAAKKLLGESDFMSRLFNYDKDKIPAKTIKLLKAYIDNPQFTPTIVGNTSVAAKSLCMWVTAIDVCVPPLAPSSPPFPPARCRCLRRASDAVDRVAAAPC